MRNRAILSGKAPHQKKTCPGRGPSQKFTADSHRSFHHWVISSARNGLSYVPRGSIKAIILTMANQVYPSSSVNRINRRPSEVYSEALVRLLKSMERTEESRKLILMTRMTNSFQRTEESRENFMMHLTPEQQYEAGYPQGRLGNFNECNE